jgi:hypothetical protein
MPLKNMVPWKRGTFIFPTINKMLGTYSACFRAADKGLF